MHTFIVMMVALFSVSPSLFVQTSHIHVDWGLFPFSTPILCWFFISLLSSVFFCSFVLVSSLHLGLFLEFITRFLDSIHYWLLHITHISHFKRYSLCSLHSVQFDVISYDVFFSVFDTGETRQMREKTLLFPKKMPSCRFRVQQNAIIKFKKKISHIKGMELKKVCFFLGHTMSHTLSFSCCLVVYFTFITFYIDMYLYAFMGKNMNFSAIFLPFAIFFCCDICHSK